MAKMRKITLKQHDQERAKNTRNWNKNKALKSAAEKEKKELEELKEQTEESKRRIEELTQEVARQDEIERNLKKEDDGYDQMELDNNDGGNSAGSEDASGGPVGSTEPNEERGEPVNSTESEDIEVLFIPPKPQGADSKDINQTPKK